MFLYENIKFLTETKISQNVLAELSGIAQSTLNDNIKNKREFKGNQIFLIYKVFHEQNLVSSLDELFKINIREKKPE